MCFCENCCCAQCGNNIFLFFFTPKSLAIGNWDPQNWRGLRADTAIAMCRPPWCQEEEEILYVLKDAADQDRLDGLTFIKLNMSVGLWALGVGIAQGYGHIA